MSKICCGPGYASPLDAMKKGDREKLLYVTTIQPNLSDPQGDYLSTIDVDPDSKTYSQIISRAFTNCIGDELHHSGWNACSSCYKISSDDCKRGNVPKRNRLILPCLGSDSVYIVDTETNPRSPKIIKKINGEILRENNCSAPHTSHCLANGNIMISTMGDKDGNGKGDFILLNSNFDCIGTWTKGNKLAAYGYDYWYQPFFDVMVASEWAAPRIFRRGFQPSDAADRQNYGHCLNFYRWSTHELIQTIDLGDEGIAPLEVRFLHNPKEEQGFVGCALYANIYHFWRPENSKEFHVKKVIDVPAKKVEGWAMPEMNGMLTDILLSLDDKFLYFSNWLHGDVRQYDITDPGNPKLTGQILLGGSILSDSKIKVTDDLEPMQRDPVIIQGRRLKGGPQMLQLSLDGKRLYVSSSLFSPWDKQFYPDMVEAGGTIVQIDVDTENGGLSLNKSFLIDFGNEPNGPTLPHEMRYPGGDCTSDIWLADE